ncbi:hypothetical protein [Microseira sp. BLCC-F43]|uniref:hypothetical protein n=1 Tax=Microseira sp. BLCC-F43 TaxID=3153602 RepID=UPI0035B9D7FD
MLTRRALARQACLVEIQDTLDIINFKIWVFNEYILVNEPNFYGITAIFHSESNEFKPQVMLYFEGRKEDEGDDPGILTTEIIFRLFCQENSITKTRLQLLAREIKQQFTTPSFKWRKGTEIVTYYKPSDGFELRLYVVNKSERVRVVQKVVGLTDRVFDPECINHSKSDRNFPVNPGTEMVLGERQKKRRRRPIGEVTFE